MNAQNYDVKLHENGMVQITSKVFRHSASYRASDLNGLINSFQSVLGDDYFMQALVDPKDRMEHWISELEMNDPDGKWLPALRILFAFRFLNLSLVTEPVAIVAAAEPQLSPEEEEKRRQMAFFKSSSHDSSNPWSPQKRN